MNPGLVGQPRDGVPVARYARYDSATRTVGWRAVAYDSAPTVAKLRRLRLVARVCYSFPRAVGRAQARLGSARAGPATRFQGLSPLS